MTLTTCGHEPHHARGLCRKCYHQRPEVMEHKKEYNKEYYQRPEVKEQMKEYYKTPKYKEYRKEYQKEYYQRPEVKEQMKEYYKTPKYKEYRKEYRKTPQYKEHQKEYQRNRGLKKLVVELEKYPWLSEESKKAMVLDGNVLEKRLNKIKGRNSYVFCENSQK